MKNEETVQEMLTRLGKEAKKREPEMKEVDRKYIVELGIDLRRMGYRDAYMDKCNKQYEPLNDFQKKAFESIREDSSSNHLIIGAGGSGKTHLAVSYAISLAWRGQSVVYKDHKNFVELVSHSKNDYEYYNEEIGTMRNANILFLDNLFLLYKFKSFVTEDQIKLYEIIEHRLLNKKQTVLIGNITTDEIMNINTEIGRKIKYLVGKNIHVVGEKDING